MTYLKNCARILMMSTRLHGVTFKQSSFSNATACNNICTVPWPQKKQWSTRWPVQSESGHTDRHSVHFPVDT